MTSLRLFVAWPLPDVISREIGRATTPLRTTLPAASWPRPESIHLTFAFLGEGPSDRVPSLAAALDSLAGSGAISLRASGVGVFPDEKRPRVAWIGIEPTARVVDLATRIRDSLAAAGASFDARPFRPHLTIARIKAPWRRSDVGLLGESFAGWSSPDATLDRIVLYSSALSPQGAVHTELHSVALG